VVLGLQEVKLLFDSVARFSYSELERLSRLGRTLERNQTIDSKLWNTSSLHFVCSERGAVVPRSWPALFLCICFLITPFRWLQTIEPRQGREQEDPSRLRGVQIGLAA